VRHTAIANGSPAGKVGQVFDVTGAHHWLVEDSHV
jgi:hypothetical protein